MAFIDADEYFVLMNSSYSSLPDLLRQYEEYGGLGVNWMMFGSSNHDKVPAGSVLQSYDMCLPTEPPSAHVLHVKVPYQIQHNLSSLIVWLLKDMPNACQ